MSHSLLLSGEDEPKPLPYAINLIGSMGADGEQARHLWSFAGASDRSNVNQTVLQPFVNYKLDQGWYLSSSPVMAANWEAKSSNRWTVPLGGGVGRVFKIGEQAVNIRVEAYGNIEVPEGGPDWAAKFMFQLLFPPKS
jgi:hypothetical protein